MKGAWTSFNVWGVTTERCCELKQTECLILGVNIEHDEDYPYLCSPLLVPYYWI